MEDFWCHHYTAAVPQLQKATQLYNGFPLASDYLSQAQAKKGTPADIPISSGSSFPLWIVFVAAGVVILVVVIVLVTRRGKTATPSAVPIAAAAPTAGPVAAPPVTAPTPEETPSARSAPWGKESQPVIPPPPVPVTEPTAPPTPAEGTAPGTSAEEEAHFCSNCGHPVHPDEKFCPNCGHELH